MITLEPPIRTGTRSCLLRYSSDLDEPVFYIYLDGVLVAETSQAEYAIAVNPGESYVIEILDDPDAQPMQVFPGKVRLNWFYVEDTEYYRIDEYVDSAWVERARMPENNGYLTWESRFLEDGQSHTFRVVPVGVNGNEGTARQFAVLMVRHPDVPDVSFGYSQTNRTITITEN